MPETCRICEESGFICIDLEKGGRKTIFVNGEEKESPLSISFCTIKAYPLMDEAYSILNPDKPPTPET